MHECAVSIAWVKIIAGRECGIKIFLIISSFCGIKSSSALIEEFDFKQCCKRLKDDNMISRKRKVWKNLKIMFGKLKHKSVDFGKTTKDFQSS